MDRANEACRAAGKISRSCLRVLDVAGEQAALADQWLVSKETRGQKRPSGRAGLVSRKTDFRGAEITSWRRDEGTETGPCRTAAGRRPVVDGTKRTRCHDGPATLRRGLPPSLEAAAAATVGGTVRGPDAAAPAGARRGGAATGCTTAMAGASAAPRDPTAYESVAHFFKPIRVSSRVGAFRRPNAPAHFTNGRLWRFLRTKPYGPSNHLLRCLCTQSAISAMPTTPPVWSFEGSSPWSKQAFLSSLSDAWTRNCPRYLVGQLRFSMSLEPCVMR